MTHEQRAGLLVLAVALATIVAMIWPLSNLALVDTDEPEVLDDTGTP